MADSTIPGLVAVTVPAVTDLLGVRQSGDTRDKKLTVTQLLSLSPAGGDVSKVGTPVDNQVGVWTGDGTIEGTTGLTYDGVALDITGNITLTGTVDGIDIATDVAANTAKVTNATHTGQVTGSGALVLDITAITAQPASGAIIAADTILINDGGVLSEATFTQMITFFDANLSFGAGDVTKVGTPVDNQVGVWTGDGTIEGTTGLTYDGVAFDVTGNITLTGTVDGIDIATDVAANTAKVTNATHTGQVTGSGALALDVTAITAQPASGAIIAADTILINDGGVLSEATFTQMLAFFDANITITNSQVSDFAAGVSGNAAVTANTAKVTNATHTGDATGSVALTIADDAVTYAKMQNVVADDVLLGNIAGAGGIVAEITGAQINLFLPVFTDALNGSVPLSGGGTTNFLRADGTWVTPAGSGDVSKVGTPVDNQVGVWTGDGTIEGTTGLTYDGVALDITGNITLTGTVDGIDIATDVAANTAKVTNATHTGQVTGATALALDVTAITAQPASGAIVAADTIITNDGGVLSEATFTQMLTFFDANLSFVPESLLASNAAGPAIVDEAATGTNPTLIPNQAELDTGIGWAASDTLSFIMGGAQGFLMSTVGFTAQNATGPRVMNEAATATNPTLLPNKSDADTGVGWNAADELSLVIGGVEGLRFTELNSGVIQVPQANLAVTAFATGGQGSATQLDESYSVIGTVATTGDSVKLPPVFAINSLIYVKNDGANAADIFPATGDNLGAGVDTAVSIPAGSSMSFIATVANSTWTQWIIDSAGTSGVTKVGTPVDNQVGVWTGDGTLEGTAGLTYDGAAFDVTGNITLSGTVDGIDIATDVAANTAKVTNATHTGQVTGATALVLDVTAITAQPASGAIAAADTIITNDGGVLSEATFTQMVTFFDANLSFGDVSKVGTPVDNQVGVWTGDGTIEGTTGLTYDGAAFDVTGNITLSGTVDGIDIATDVAANTAKVTNATHTGQVTGATALILDVTAITAQPASGAVVDADTLLINDGGVLSEVTFTQIETWVAATTAVAANTAKVTNATHTGQVTGATALALDVTAVTAQPASGALVAADTIITNDGGVLSESTFTQLLAFFDANITFPEQFTEYHWGATDFSNPNNSDWEITNLAPAVVDSNDNALTVRAFDDTAQEAVGLQFKLPDNATQLTIQWISRAETTPGGAVVAKPELFFHDIPDNAAVPGNPWSSFSMNDTDLTTNEFFQYDSQTITFSTLSLTAGEYVQMEFARDPGHANDDLVGDWIIFAINISFS